MRNISRKTAVLTVMVLIIIIQLAFTGNGSSQVNSTNINQNMGSMDYVEDMEEKISEEKISEEKISGEISTEEVVISKLNVVYSNNIVNKDVSVELSEDRELSDYENKIVSYTLSELNIYDEPSYSSKVNGVMYSGSEADIIDRGEEWSKVVSGDVTGYIRNVDVLFGKEAEVIASSIGEKTANVSSDCQVYVAPDEKALVISSLATGANVDAYEESGMYTLISCDNGFGYVKTANLSVSYGLPNAMSMAELEAIAEAEREAAALAAAEAAKAQAEAALEAAKQNAISTGVVTRNAYNASEEEIHLLTAIIYWESGWEPAEGQLAVANVVLNRVFSARFSQNTITSVVYAPGQFSGVVENGIPSARFQTVLNMSNEELNSRGCYNAALRALAGENNVGDLLFFISAKKANLSKYTQYMYINNHCFYTY